MTQRFANPHQKNVRRTFFHFLLWQLGFYREKKPLMPIPQGFVYPNPESIIDRDQPIVTWVNHSTFLINAYGKSLLVDPIWNERCSPVAFWGPKRYMPAKPHFESVGKVDYVIVSHNHYDHLDKETLIRLCKKNPSILLFVPKGVKKWAQKALGINSTQIIELAWWQTHVHDKVTFTATPAQHFSGRGFFDVDRSLWMGCVVEFEQKKLYFAGDTGYNQFDFKEIGKKFGGFDLSLLPIGVYRPRAFMQPVHVNPQEAVRIHQEVASRLSVAGHWGTFRLSEEDLDRPPFDLYCALEEAHVSTKHFRVLKAGQSINW